MVLRAGRYRPIIDCDWLAWQGIVGILRRVYVVNIVQ